MPRKGNIENVIFWGNRYTNPVETGFMVEILWTSYLPGWRLGKQSGDRRMNGTLYDILVREPNTHTHTHTYIPPLLQKYISLGELGFGAFPLSNIHR